MEVIFGMFGINTVSAMRKQLKAAVTAESEPLFCPQFSQGGLGLGTGTAERDFLRFSM